MTDEGKQKLGITNANQQISDYTTNYQNNIIDLQNKAAQTATDFQNQISDVKDSVAKNTTWMQAEGAWTGA